MKNKVSVYNETDNKFNEKIIKPFIDKALHHENITGVEFNIIMVDNETIRELNNQYRNKDCPTDVLSFAIEDINDIIKYKYRLIGDIYI